MEDGKKNHSILNLGLLDVAKKVELKANMYNNQLKNCENKLNKKGIFGIF